jgi:FtsZ-binding cell division protein ZapB
MDGMEYADVVGERLERERDEAEQQRDKLQAECSQLQEELMEFQEIAYFWLDRWEEQREGWGWRHNYLYDRTKAALIDDFECGDWMCCTDDDNLA